jgi:hypothetical protein
MFKLLITRAPKYASCAIFPKLFMTVTSPVYFFGGGGVVREGAERARSVT